MARVLHTKVAGVTKKNRDTGEDRQDIIESYCSAGDELRLEREEDNAYNPNAIAVYCDYGQIGYLKDELANEFAPRMDNGLDLRAEIAQITGGEDGKTMGVNIRLLIPERGDPEEPEAALTLDGEDPDLFLPYGIGGGGSAPAAIAEVPGPLADLRRLVGQVRSFYWPEKLRWNWLRWVWLWLALTLSLALVVLIFQLLGNIF